jgi:hypothetical protein
MGIRRFSLSDWGHIAEILGAMAVIVSLLYVGKQLKHNTEAVEGQTLQEILSNYQDHQLAILGEESMAPLIVKAEAKQELSPEERLRLDTWSHLVISNWERAFNSYQSGLMGKNDWTGWDRYFRGTFEYYPFMQDAWRNNAIEGYEDGFSRYINEVVLGAGTAVGS